MTFVLVAALAIGMGWMLRGAAQQKAGAGQQTNLDPELRVRRILAGMPEQDRPKEILNPTTPATVFLRRRLLFALANEENELAKRAWQGFVLFQRQSRTNEWLYAGARALAKAFDQNPGATDEQILIEAKSALRMLAVDEHRVLEFSPTERWTEGEFWEKAANQWQVSQLRAWNGTPVSWAAKEFEQLTDKLFLVTIISGFPLADGDRFLERLPAAGEPVASLLAEASVFAQDI